MFQNDKSHTLSIEQGLIPSTLANIDVNPSLAMNTVDLCPNMILTVPDPSHSTSDSSAEHAETVGPLANSAPAGLQKYKRIVVAWESLVSTTMCMGTLIELDAVCAARLLVRKRGGHTLCNGLRVAVGTLWVIDPLEETTFEPAHECSDYAILIAPGRLCVWSE